MTEATFTASELEFAEQYPTLGADYKRAQDVAERYMSHFRDTHFKELVDKFSDEFRDKLWGDVSSWFIADTESNLQTEIRHAVDATIGAILRGDQWALSRYPLSQYHDGQKIRAAIFAEHKDEIIAAGIKDRDDEIARLKEQLEWARR